MGAPALPVVRSLQVAALLAISVVLGSCASRTSAPVITRSPSSAAATPAATAAPPATAPARASESGAEFYTVKRGDTLYSIALDHGTSYRELAEWNNLANPNVIRVDQVLRVRPPAEQGGVQVRPLAAAGAAESRPLAAAGAAESRPLAAAGEAIKSEPRAVKLPYSDENLALLSRPRSQPAVPAPARPQPAVVEARSAPPQQAENPDDDDKVDWGWPTAGRVSAGFSQSNKGVDIGGRSGQPVVASASGTVLYVGSGIRGYGKLIVIRHNKAYSTVYAHNNEILVKEGQRVVKGQKVAEMGNSDADQVKLHFEIRRLGNPIDPSRLLPAS